MTDSFSESLHQKINGLLYFSESENLYTVEIFQSKTTAAVPSEIAALLNIPENQIAASDADAFFNHIAESADPNDSVVAANAAKTKDLYAFLKANLSELKVYRVALGARVSIYIVGTGQDGLPVVLKTVSVES